MNDLIQSARNSLAAGHEARTTVRALLAAFGSERRRASVVERIRSALHEAQLVTVPDFTSTWIDAEISFVVAAQELAKLKDADVSFTPQAALSTLAPGEPKEAIHLIRMLSAANRGVTYVSPQHSIETAVTIMLAHDFSQLAVMTGPRDLKGVVSWKSIGGRLAQRAELRSVSDAMEPGIIVKETASLFDATALIINNEFVFVAAPDNRIVGIVTATDLSEQFQSLSEPFLLIGQIENQIRNLMHDRFDLETLRAACNDNDPERKKNVNGTADLTLGEYIRILEVDANWAKLNIFGDRVTFIKELDKVREIRNEVMHFDPDGIEEDQFTQLRKFSKFLKQLQTFSGRNAG